MIQILNLAANNLLIQLGKTDRKRKAEEEQGEVGAQEERKEDEEEETKGKKARLDAEVQEEIEMDPASSSKWRTPWWCRRCN